MFIGTPSKTNPSSGGAQQGVDTIALLRSYETVNRQVVYKHFIPTGLTRLKKLVRKTNSSNLLHRDTMTKQNSSPYCVSAPVTSTSFLKVKFKGKLNYAWPSACGNNPAERRKRDVVNRVGVVDPVKGIEKLDPGFTFETLVDRDEFDQRKVNVLLSRPGQEVSRRVAERIGRIECRIGDHTHTRAIQART
jgi:hypothetical protein